MIVIGFHAITALFESGQKVHAVHALERAHERTDDLRQLAQKAGARWQGYSAKDRQRFEGELKRLGGSAEDIASCNGLFAQAADFTYADFDELLERVAEAKPAPLLLFLDSITDPQNLGSILRSAAFFSVSGLVLTEHRSASLTPTALKISSGGFAHVPVSQVVNLSQALERAKEVGYWVVGLSEHADADLHTARLDGPIALVVGNEEKGIRPLTQKTCDLTVALPGGGGIKSLNAAVASAVALALVRERQRQLAE